jgi:hypothetical protein
MMMRALTGAALSLALSLGFSTAVRAAVVDFEDVAVAPNSYLYSPDSFADGGLFFQDQSITVIPNGLLSLPRNNASQFMEVGAQPDVLDRNLIVSLDGGGAFDLTQFKMGLGDLNHQSSGGTDYVTIEGHKANCASDCDTGPVTVPVNYGWMTYNLTGFTGLDSITFFQQVMMVDGAPVTDAGWLAFDDIDYDLSTGNGGDGGDGGPVGVTAVPEPMSWALMILGFAAVGSALRSRRRTLLAA